VKCLLSISVKILEKIYYLFILLILYLFFVKQLFFSCNHNNHVSYITLKVCKIYNIKTTHDDLQTVIMMGCNKSFHCPSLEVNNTYMDLYDFNKKDNNLSRAMKRQ
jgi:hypothetical protein